MPDYNHMVNAAKNLPGAAQLTLNNEVLAWEDFRGNYLWKEPFILGRPRSSWMRGSWLVKEFFCIAPSITLVGVYVAQQPWNSLPWSVAQWSLHLGSIAIVGAALASTAAGYVTANRQPSGSA